MSLLRKLGDAIHKIDYNISNDPEIKGQRFEDHVENLFSKKYFSIVEKTHSFKTNEKRYVESSLNPDFIIRYNPTGEVFGVECKFRTSLNNRNQLEWANQSQLKRYQEFSKTRKIPIFIVIGLELEFENEDDWDLGDEIIVENYMFNIPLPEAKYPALYESVFTKFERPYDKPFFWKNGELF
jgi:hypothetical protein